MNDEILYTLRGGDIIIKRNAMLVCFYKKNKILFDIPLTYNDNQHLDKNTLLTMLHCYEKGYCKGKKYIQDDIKSILDIRDYDPRY